MRCKRPALHPLAFWIKEKKEILLPQLGVRGTSENVEIGKILCLGSNYDAHIREMRSPKPDEPVVFMKPASALISGGQNIVIPQISKNVHHEVELVAIIGDTTRRVAREAAMRNVLGYAVGIDVTLRDVQAAAKEKGRPWTVAKGFDTSAPVSEIVLAGEVDNPHDLGLRLFVNKEKRQDGRTSEMIFKLDEIISYLSSIFTLNRGDLIFTGTPEGVGPVVEGDRIRAELDGLVFLEVGVVSDDKT